MGPMLEAEVSPPPPQPQFIGRELVPSIPIAH